MSRQATMQELAARTGMRDFAVRSLQHGAAPGDEGDAAAATLLVSDGTVHTPD